MGYIERTETDRSTLTSAGADEVSAWKGWAKESMARLGRALTARAEEEGIDAPPDRVEFWVSILTTAIFEGVMAAHATFSGAIDPLGGRAVVPRKYDTERMRAVIREFSQDERVRAFLDACVLEALDPSSAFASDLVSHVAVAYMLLAFLAHRDRMEARGMAGSLAGSWAILDTPLLIPLLGVDEDGRAIRAGIEAARRAGMRVVVPAHCIDEVRGVVARLGRDYEGILSSDDEAKVRLDIVRHIVNEPFFNIWYTAREAGRYSAWADLERAVEGLFAELTSLGAEVTTADVRHREDLVEQFIAALEEVLEEDNHGRGINPIRRDAATMAVAARVRRTLRLPVRVWPSAWIVTWDRRMGRAYARVVATDKAALTMAPSTWLAVASACSDPVPVATLARSAARLLAQETMLAVAATYPVPAALEIANALAGDVVESPLTVRRVQLQSVDDVLESGAAEVADPREVALRVAGGLMGARRARLRVASQAEMERLADERDHAARRAARERKRADDEAVRRERAEHERDVATSELNSQGSNADEGQLRRVVVRRAMARATLCVLLLMATGVLAFTSHGIAAVGMAATLVVFGLTSSDWVAEPELSARKMFLSLLPQLLWLAEWLQP